MVHYDVVYHFVKKSRLHIKSECRLHMYVLKFMDSQNEKETTSSDSLDFILISYT